MDLQARYLDSLVASWEAVGSSVVRIPGAVVSFAPDRPVFNNALLLAPAALGSVRAAYPEGAPWAVWTRDEPCAAAVSEAGLRPDVGTTAMALRLGPLPAPTGGIDLDADPAVVVALNGL